MPYIKFTDEEIERAGQVDLVDLLRSQGETLKKEGKWYRWNEGSDKVSICGNTWFHQYERKGGNAISFVRRFMNKEFSEAVQYLLGNGAGELIQPRQYQPPPKEEKKDFQLPPRDKYMSDVNDYLMGARGIYPPILQAFVDKGLIYSSPYKSFHNATFVGVDKDGVPRHAHIRGTGGSFRMNIEGSDDNYSFHWNGTNEKVYLFEAPIDMLSYICLQDDDNWKENTYIAACGVSAKPLLQSMKDNPMLSKVYLCLDNDEKGQEFDLRIKAILDQRGIESEILVPVCKDWNEDLITLDVAEDESEDEECNLTM